MTRRLARRSSLALAFLLSGLAGIAGCSAASPEPRAAEDLGTPPPATPEHAPPPGASPPAPEASAEPAAPPVPEAGASTDEPKKASGPEAWVPDDYSLTAGDCAELGRKLADLIRSDARAALDPKLSAKQREQGEASIDRAVEHREREWLDTCRGSLVGKIVDRTALQCAMRAGTVKAFDECLNGPPPAKP